MSKKINERIHQPQKIFLREKDLLQIESDLYIFGEGKGMCQDGAVNLIQLDIGGDPTSIRFHKKDIPRIIKALTGKYPIMNSINEDEFGESLRILGID